jgi:hypothetical protein
MEDILALSGFLFFVMASNIGSIVKILRRMERNSISIDQSLERIKGTLINEESSKLSDQEKARRFDQSK